MRRLFSLSAFLIPLTRSRIASRSVPSSTSESAADAVAKKTGVSVKTNGPVHTRASRRSAVLDAVREGTPVPEAREVSMMFKNPPLSPEEPTSTLIATQTPSRGIAGPLVTSTPRSVLRNIPKPSIQLATSAFQRIQTDTRQTANKLLLASRLVRSCPYGIASAHDRPGSLQFNQRLAYLGPPRVTLYFVHRHSMEDNRGDIVVHC